MDNEENSEQTSDMNCIQRAALGARVALSDMGDYMMQKSKDILDDNVYSSAISGVIDVIYEGVNFENLWYASCSDEILDNAEDEGGLPFSGLTYELYDNGQLIYYCSYKDGFPYGEEIWFYKNGNIKTRKYKKYGRIFGKEETWFEDGKLKSLSEYEFGVCLSYKEWDKDGKLINEKIEPTENEKKLLLHEKEWNKKLGRD